MLQGSDLGAKYRVSAEFDTSGSSCYWRNRRFRLFSWLYSLSTVTPAKPSMTLYANRANYYASHGTRCGLARSSTSLLALDLLE